MRYPRTSVRGFFYAPAGSYANSHMIPVGFSDFHFRWVSFDFFSPRTPLCIAHNSCQFLPSFYNRLKFGKTLKTLVFSGIYDYNKQHMTKWPFALFCQYLCGERPA